MTNIGGAGALRRYASLSRAAVLQGKEPEEREL
jgi:hypothetical protein